ncbi:MAG: glycosyltransferase family 9 protein [Gemmatimonadetes bacterium]|uniref:Glycosyltransferase family 9 protein n=1 Tax=Candidatus Kutchimonas denitrificans TaxID=3056748 RepID=A0AAE4ZC70_9BACT|nr:glycosyltransferase family 9 protein [Gemmatimonadota bacterium]NIR75731.1 glycosyltransferase family 9 protein [Candidatus Kutchimonas denitrificans]NIS00344.1 glycosyltransferase family 9 protein [Gemmatimonadota bacterium]NIT66003.1 glycosyltransferase family 9 protein [Gemmatimonadota bacterium]NIU53707.1 hypothetical protein [Gemmatimonadota bacterium]
MLVTRLRWLGDVVMSTPILEALRAALPAASIEYLTYTSFAPALLRHPAVDRIHTVTPKPGLRETAAKLRELRRAKFDWCFDTLGNPRSAILVALSGARRTAAPDRGPRSRLYDHRIRHESDERSAVRHQLDVLKPLLGRVEERQPSLHVEPWEIEGSYAGQGLDPEEPLVLVHPGATWPERAWPIERWAPLIDKIGELHPHATVRVITQPGWEAAARQVEGEAADDARALPALDLRTLIALLAGADLYVGNDSGILHCAVALRTPTVGIFGPTEDDVWFPYERWGPYRVVRRETSGRTDARVEEVAVAVAEVMKSKGI